MHEAYKRILKSLDIEKHLTQKQITRLLYPEEFKSDAQGKAYGRINKNLLYLKKQNLLKSKSYGLGKEYFWSLRRHPVIAELGFEPPRAEVHAFKYEHEKQCAEVFVSLALTEKLYDWQPHKRISKGIIPDRMARFENRTFYFEIERGTQDKVIQKTENYRKFWCETKEEFSALFLVKDEKALEDSVNKLEAANASDHYCVGVFLQFIDDPLNAVLTSAHRSISFLEML